MRDGRLLRGDRANDIWSALEHGVCTTSSPLARDVMEAHGYMVKH